MSLFLKIGAVGFPLQSGVFAHGMVLRRWSNPSPHPCASQIFTKTTKQNHLKLA